VIRNTQPSEDLWDIALARDRRQVVDIMGVESPPRLPEDDDVTSKLFEFFRNKRCWTEATNFTEREVVRIFQDMQHKFGQHRSRGPNPAIDNLDSLLLLLHWLKTGSDFAQIATNSGYGECAVRTAILRAKDALLEFLKEKWWGVKQRPVPLESSPHPFIGLICDSTSTEVYRPMAHFEEAKVLWDGKNKMYALKKEVCVMASVPHYALFTSSAFAGAEHDYSQFKKNFEQYAKYLKKLPQERHQLPRDTSEASWAILCDSAYIGDRDDTPGLRKVALKKRSQVLFPTDRQEQQDLARTRVPIECFFGRLKKLWGVLRAVYRWVPYIHDFF